MPTLRPSAPPPDSTPEQALLAALRSSRPEQRQQAAERGLALGPGVTRDTQVLLLRQLYLAHVELRQLRRAAEIATRAAALGPLQDIAWHDASRALSALGEGHEALLTPRRAARSAPPERRSFQLWGLATLQHHAGDVDAALATLQKAMRSAQRDRALLRAHAAYIRLDAGRPARNLRRTLDTLRASPNAEGYGRFLLGMIAHLMGDQREAIVHLQAFLRRNADAGLAKELTLREELRRARAVLAKIDSH
ncbi:MAG: tetratricopeptide repeat protein [Sandaracinaceae bacterium]|nr:tetratricopeptide repeat protein [Sandaracinaceae bacterium]